MAEYIKREDVSLSDFEIVMCNGDYKEALKMLLEKVEKIPSADVVERETGTWGKENECSECGCQPWFYHDIHTLNFCPNCGARMVEDD